jgi:ankyrin repeat protein
MNPTLSMMCCPILHYSSYVFVSQAMYQLRLLKLLTRHCPILNQLGHTALVAAATEGHAEVVKLLLDAKIGVNRTNKVSISEILEELTLNDIDMF